MSSFVDLVGTDPLLMVVASMVVAVVYGFVRAFGRVR